MSPSILMISALDAAKNCADLLSSQLGCSVEVAASQKAALAALRRREYALVIIDDCLGEADASAAELIWKNTGLALPIQVNFGIASSARIAREVRAALARRAQEHALALRSAASTLEVELKSTVTGLLLQSQLALAEPKLTPELTNRLKIVAELASTLRQRLDRPQA